MRGGYFRLKNLTHRNSQTLAALLSPMLFSVFVADDLFQSSPDIVDSLIDAFCDLVSIN